MRVPRVSSPTVRCVLCADACRDGRSVRHHVGAAGRRGSAGAGAVRRLLLGARRPPPAARRRLGWSASIRPRTRRRSRAHSTTSQLALSSKTTFDAITYALERTTLTDASGQRFGDALDLIEHLESIRGQIDNASGDHQFRMYVAPQGGHARSAQPFPGVQARGRQLGVSPRLPAQLPAAGRLAVDPDLDRARRPARRHRRGLPLVEFSGGALQRAPDGVELRRPCRQQLRPAHGPLERLPELVAQLLRRRHERGRPTPRPTNAPRSFRTRRASATRRWKP